jgi:hypothetical protein
MRLAATLLFAAHLMAQSTVSVLLTPESGSSTANVFGKGKVVVWDCSLCNDSSLTVTVPPERVYMSAPTLHHLDLSRATAQLQSSYNHRALPILITTLGWAADGAVVFMGGRYIAATPKVIGAVGAGGAAARFLAGKLQGVTPQFASLLPNLLSESVVLPPGQCTTRTVLASQTRKENVIQSTITLPVSAVSH